MSARSHEDFVEHGERKLPSERSFGWTVGGVLLALGLLRAWLHGGWAPLAIALAGCGLVLIAIAAVMPRVLAPLNRLWMGLGLLLARITNPVIMAAIFGLVFTPFAVVMRMRGRDPLRLRRDGAARSYWIDRDPPGPSPQSVEHQF